MERDADEELIPMDVKKQYRLVVDSLINPDNDNSCRASHLRIDFSSQDGQTALFSTTMGISNFKFPEFVKNPQKSSFRLVKKGSTETISTTTVYKGSYSDEICIRQGEGAAFTKLVEFRVESVFFKISPNIISWEVQD